MSFDKFLLAVESHDLSQADKCIMRVSSFPKLFLNDEMDQNINFAKLASTYQMAFFWYTCKLYHSKSEK